jgi:hypothetical protein
MSAITKKQMKTLMTEVKDGRILKKVLNDDERGDLFCQNQSFKATIKLYNLEKYHNIKSGRNNYKDQISYILKERNIVLGRRKEDKPKQRKRSSFTYDADPFYFDRKRQRAMDWNKRIAEMARYEAMGALWCGTPLCEDVIGEILSFLY